MVGCFWVNDERIVFWWTNLLGKQGICTSEVSVSVLMVNSWPLALRINKFGYAFHFIIILILLIIISLSVVYILTPTRSRRFGTLPINESEMCLMATSRRFTLWISRWMGG